MKANKEEMQVLYTAFDIHRRVATLTAMWIAFDPFGAAVYTLRVLESVAWQLREAVDNLKIEWDYTKQPNHPLRKIKEGKDEYGTFRNHFKGIEAAMRRLSLNPYFIRNLYNSKLQLSYKNLEYALSLVRDKL